MIPESFIQELLNRLDIVDVVDRHVPLKKAGANYQACCPFHGEKTPSFTVSPSKQFYHCFGCGAHGTAIRFVMEYQGLGFVEAVEELANGIGLPVPRETAHSPRNLAAESGDLAGIMQQAMQYYRSQLKQSETAIAYLKQRGLSGEIAARFGIGYAPAGWQGLSSVFPDYRENKSLVLAGLVVEGEDDKRYDRFRDRIMFPILNQRMAVIGFGGRVLGAGEPKYLNSPETPLFEKGRELYGFPQARQAIRKAGVVLVVEGYMDVVALAQHGVGYAVATLGTATTPEHVRKLLRQSDHVVFSFDGDAAGRKAAWRALENSLALTGDDKRLSFLFLPQGEDPDSYIRAHGQEAFERLLREALPLSEFLERELVSRVDMSSQEGRAKLLTLAQPLLQQVAAPTLGLMLRKRLAELAGIAQAELESLFRVEPVASARPAPARTVTRKQPSLVRALLKWLLLEPKLFVEIDDIPLPDGLPDGEALQALLGCLAAGTSSTAGILEHFRDTAYESLLRDLSGEIAQIDGEFDAHAEFVGALARLREDTDARKASRLLKKRLGDLSEDERRFLQQHRQSGEKHA